MCSINAHYRQQPTYVDYERSGVSREIFKNSTIAAINPIIATLDFIDCWLKNFHKNYQ